MSAVITGSGKTLAFGIPMIHAILEWKSGSEKPADDDPEPTTKVESLYLPALDESTVEDDNMEAEGEDGDSITEQDQGDTDEHDSEDEHDDVEEKDDDERIGCVKVIENAVFDFDVAAEAEEEEEAAGGRSQPLLGLVLTPTRELAVQVKHHIDAVAKFTGKSLKFYDYQVFKKNYECGDTEDVPVV